MNKNSNSIIVVGDYISFIYEEAIYSELFKRGYNVKKFKHIQFPIVLKILRMIPFFKNFYKLIIFFNEYKLKKFIKVNNPNYIFFYRPQMFSNDFFYKIKYHNKETKIICYNNDNAFSKKYKPNFWSNFLSNCKHADFILAYRESDINKYKKISGADVIHFPAYVTDFILKKSKERNKNYSNSMGITFIGHYEDDGRLEILNYLYKNNLDIRLYGPKSGWNSNIIKRNIGLQFLPVKKLDYLKYVNYLSDLNIGLCFLSKLNKDFITRRCFELTYMGVCLVSEYNDYLANLFLEDKEAIYFRNKEELLDKLNYLVKNKNYLKEVSQAGRKKCLALKVTPKDRVNTLENSIFNKL